MCRMIVQGQINVEFKSSRHYQFQKQKYPCKKIKIHIHPFHPSIRNELLIDDIIILSSNASKIEVKRFSDFFIKLLQMIIHPKFPFLSSFTESISFFLLIKECLLCKPCCPSVQTIKRKIHLCLLQHFEYPEYTGKL